MNLDILRKQALQAYDYYIKWNTEYAYFEPMFNALLPLRGESNILEKIANLENQLFVHISTYSDFIYFLLYGQVDENSLLDFYNYLYYHNYTFENVSTNWKFGTNTQKYKSYEETYNDCLNLFYENDSDEYINAIGNLAEYIAYYKLLENPNLTVVHVSKYIGDGYGFDIMAYDNITGHCQYIEVKGTIADLGWIEKELTDNEARTFEYINNNNLSESYHVYIISLQKNNEQLYYDMIDYYYDGKDLHLVSQNNEYNYSPVNYEKIQQQYKKAGYIKLPK